MKRISVFLVAMLLFQQWAMSQASIFFEKSSHNFGVIKEEDGLVTAEFIFKNNGNEPLQLNSVAPSCGCTAADWTKESVLPGKTGFVKATYDPKSRPGKFDKSVTVVCNGVPSTVILKISGEVTPRPKGPKDTYPFEIGNLRLKTNHIAFGQLFRSETDTSSNVVYNQGKKPIKIDLNATKLPAHLKMEMTKTTINPGETANMKFWYDATKKNDFGFVNESFNLVTDDSVPNKTIWVSADLQQKFTEEDKKNPPKVVFDKLSHDFGVSKQGDVLTTTFSIINAGTRDLNIFKCKASCGCTVVNPEKNLLKPGESTTLKVTFYTAGKQGKNSKTITVITNDPTTPVSNLVISSEIQVLAPVPAPAPNPAPSPK